MNIDFLRIVDAEIVYLVNHAQFQDTKNIAFFKTVVSGHMRDCLVNF